MSDWWYGVEDALTTSSAQAPDPWAHLPEELPELTDAQLSFLDQIAAQPSPVRLSDDDHDEPDTTTEPAIAHDDPFAREFGDAFSDRLGDAFGDVPGHGFGDTE